MFKFRYLLFILATAFFWSANAEAKVCFLVNADGSENCSEAGFVGETSCIGMGCQYCARPRTDSSPCIEGQNCYHKDDCCSPENGYDGEDCPEPKKCYTKTGQIVDGCPTGDTEVCPTNAVCRCPAEYKYVKGSDYPKAPDGTTLCVHPKTVGEEYCDEDGVRKYKTCECPSDWYLCSNYNADGVGTACVDNGKEYFESCVCDMSIYSEPSSCCWGSSGCCTFQGGENHNKRVCKCNGNPYSCQCDYKSNNGCYSGCIDDQYTYIGKLLSNVSFSEQISAKKSGEICANGPCCTPGNWDKTEWCDANTCTALGYTETSCGSRPFVGCPCDITKKRCLGGGGSSSTCPKGQTTYQECLDKGWTPLLSSGQTPAPDDCIRCLKFQISQTCPEGQITYKECLDKGWTPIYSYKPSQNQDHNADECVGCQEPGKPDTSCDRYAGQCEEWKRMLTNAVRFRYYQNVSYKTDKWDHSPKHHENDDKCSKSIGEVGSTVLPFNDPCLQTITGGGGVVYGDQAHDISPIRAACEGTRNMYLGVVDKYNECCQDNMQSAIFSCDQCYDWTGPVPNCQSHTDGPNEGDEWDI